MKTEKPIFDIIDENIVDGKLKDDFLMPDADGFQGDPRLKMAPGAIDGICIYHMKNEDLSEEGIAAISAAIQAAAAGSDEAYELFEKLGEKHRAIVVIDDIQDYIREHANRLDQGELLRFAFEDLILGGTDSECVKFGLIISELYGEFDDDLKSIIREVGLYDEFTIFSVFNMLTWKNGNEELFELANRVDGWGKIHAIERLEPESQEIRDWILYKGIDNDVLPEYLALTCMIKSGAAQRLKGQPSKEEFSAISHIFGSLFDEGPVWGISRLPDTEETLTNYLNCAEQLELGVEDYEAVLNIRDYAETDGLYPNLVYRAERILHTDQCMEFITEAVKDGNGVRLAKFLGLPYKDQLMELMRRDFKRAYHWCNTIMDDPNYIDSILSLYRREVPPNIIEQDPRDEYEFGNEFEAYRIVNFMIQNLAEYPGKGIDYLMKTISAPVTRSRLQTIRVLKAWVSSAGEPLQECYPELYSRLKEAFNNEPDEKLRADIKSLLDGKTIFSDRSVDDGIDEDEGSV